MRTYFLIALSSLIALACADDNMFELDKKGGRRYCGPELRRALMLVCESTYKRSSPDSSSAPDDWVMNVIGVDDSQMYPFRSRAKAFAVIPEYFRRQTRQGVADECCYKSCTIRELSTYCGKKEND